VTDQIIITGLRAIGYHGVFDEERRSGQEFIVDAVLDVDLVAAGDSDALGDTVHYGEVADRIIGIIQGPPRDLIEAVAAEIATSVLNGFSSVRAIEVTVHKPDAPLEHDFADVAVRIRRGKA
jgi:dihydroneopterin aldolase